MQTASMFLSSRTFRRSSMPTASGYFFSPVLASLAACTWPMRVLSGSQSAATRTPETSLNQRQESAPRPPRPMKPMLTLSLAPRTLRVTGKVRAAAAAVAPLRNRRREGETDDWGMGGSWIELNLTDQVLRLGLGACPRT